MTRLILVMLVCAFYFAPNILYGQQISGRVSLDDGGKAVEFANVVLKPGDYGTVTNGQGHFEFNNIPEGSYNISVSMVGFITQSQRLKVSKEKPVKLNISLIRDTKEIDEIKVLANFQQKEILRDPTVEQYSIVSSITSISKTEIERQGAVTLVDALKYVPGGWTETRGRKVKQFFSVRGQKYPYPSYSINGIWQKEFHEMPYFFNSSNIQEVKIIRSSSALVKSLSALTGVIDVSTKHPTKKETNLYIKYGSLNTYHSGISYGNKLEKVKYRFGVNGLGTNGPDGRNGKENIWNTHGFVQYQINSELDLSVNLFYLNGTRQLVQPTEPADQKFINRKEIYDPINTLMISSKLIYTTSDKFSSELQVNYAGRDLNYKNENLVTEKVVQYEESDSEITVNQLNALALSGKNTLRMGALYNYWQAPEGKRFYYGRKAEVHTISGVITDQQSFGKILLDAGFRLTQEYYAEWGGFSIEGSGGKFTNVAPIKDEWQSPVWQATSGISYSFSPSSALNFSFAGGIIKPRKGALTNEGKTPDDEVRFNYDLGYSQDILHLGKLTLTSFWVTRKNSIDYSGNILENEFGDIMELYKNVNKRNYGIEAEFKSVEIQNTFSFFTNLAIMKGAVKSQDNWQPDDEMPEIIANIGGSYVKRKFDINAYLNYTGAYKNNRFVSKNYLSENGKAPLGDFVNLDLTAGYFIDKKQNIRVFMEGKNLIDIKYQTVPGYPDNGRMISGGCSISL